MASEREGAIRLAARLERDVALLLCPAWRPLRAMGTGGLAALVQLGLSCAPHHWFDVALVDGTEVATLLR